MYSCVIDDEELAGDERAQNIKTRQIVNMPSICFQIISSCSRDIRLVVRYGVC